VSKKWLRAAVPALIVKTAVILNLHYFKKEGAIMKPKVILYNRAPQDVLDYVSETCQVVHFDQLTEHTYRAFQQELRDAVGIMGAGLKVDDELLEQAPLLRIVSNVSVGYNNLFIPNLTARNVMATNTPGVLSETTADTVFALILATARRIAELHVFVREGRWKDSISEEHFGLNVHHKTLGIIGMGRIGAAIAKRANKVFDMQVLYHNRSRNEEAETLYDAAYVSLDDLLQRSDFVCIMTPLTSETENMIGEREFKLMKKTGIFINAARGRVIDEEALVKALQNGHIWGAGLDVFTEEPIDPNNPLLRMDRVVTVPHIGSATKETRDAMARLAAENLVRGVSGERPPNLINPEVWAQKTAEEEQA
jgi:glyoxylate/hydroxypyruvate/2-ketogluconate reductase